MMERNQAMGQTSRRWELGSDMALRLNGERVPVSSFAVLAGLRLYQHRWKRLAVRTPDNPEVPEALARLILSTEVKTFAYSLKSDRMSRQGGSR